MAKKLDLPERDDDPSSPTTSSKPKPGPTLILMRDGQEVRRVTLKRPDSTALLNRPPEEPDPARTSCRVHMAAICAIQPEPLEDARSFNASILGRGRRYEPPEDDDLDYQP